MSAPDADRADPDDDTRSALTEVAVEVEGGVTPEEGAAATDAGVSDALDGAGTDDLDAEEPGTRGMLGALWETEPDTPIEEVEGLDLDPDDRHRYLMRGLSKYLNGYLGVGIDAGERPAWFDLGVYVLLEVQAQNAQAAGGDGSGSGRGDWGDW